MNTEKKMDLQNVIERILRERLEQFEVPLEIRNTIRDELLAFFQRPQTKPFGATCMTPEASMAADKARKAGRVQTDGPTPQVM